MFRSSISLCAAGGLFLLFGSTPSWAQSSANGMQDGDGNAYLTVRIGNQVWTRGNLRTTSYRNGEPIANVSDPEQWRTLTAGGWAVYGNEAANASAFGHLYNAYAVADGRGMCEQGWRVPTDADWTALTDGQGGSSAAGGKLKSASSSQGGDGLWQAPNTGATDESGFHALPGGYRLNEPQIFGDESFQGLGTSAAFWSSTQDVLGSQIMLSYWTRQLSHESAGVVRTPGFAALGYSVRCVWETEAVTFSQVQVTDSAATSARVSVRASANGGLTFERRGVVWGASSEPVLGADSAVEETGDWLSGDAAPFTLEVSGLEPETRYHARAFVVFADSDTLYGPATEFSTKALETGGSDTVLDVDGNRYATVWIGDQLWMAENLRTTSYRNGDSIPNVTGDGAWYDLTSGPGGWAYYANDESNGPVYGALYNWHAAADPRGLCPDGWSVPSDADWTALSDALGGEAAAGGKLKATGTTEWTSPNQGATDESGFGALPAGTRYNTGPFGLKGRYAYYWTSSASDETFAWFRRLSFDESALSRESFLKNYGYSVRCLRDARRMQVDSVIVDAVTDTRMVVVAGVQAGEGSTVTERGLVWSRGADPTLEANEGLIRVSAVSGSVKSQVPGLEPSTSYHVRAWAVNSAADTVYGPGVQVTTARRSSKPGTILDVELNDYGTLQVGAQLWMAGNLRTSRFNDGSRINGERNQDYVIQNWTANDHSTWWRYPDDDPALNETDGKRYNFNVIEASYQGGICPAGWRVPSAGDWRELRDHLGGTSLAGGAVKRLFGESSVGWWSSTMVERHGFYDEGTALAFYVWTLDNDLEELEFSQFEGFAVRCVQNQRPITVNQASARKVLDTTAVFRARAAHSGGAEVVRTGVVWSLDPEPGLERNHGMGEASADGAGWFDVEAAGLLPDTVYHARAWAVNAYSDTSYSEPLQFRTLPLGTVTAVDVDGNVYVAAQIGDQLWTTQSLRTTRFRDSSAIPLVTDANAWSSAGAAAMANYDNDAAQAEVYGSLYNAHAVADSRGLCPEGWRVPEAADWAALIAELGGTSVAGGTLKSTGTLEAGTGLWRDPNGGATNETGFSAHPGGVRYAHNGVYGYKGSIAYFWVAPVEGAGTAERVSFAYGNPRVFQEGAALGTGYSVRCMRDNPRPLFGDVDGNGQVQAYDAAVVMHSVVGRNLLAEADPFPWEEARSVRADVDGDGKLLAMDASWILQYLVGLIPDWPVNTAGKAPAAPEVGVRSTGDEVVFSAAAGGLAAFEVELPLAPGLRYGEPVGGAGGDGAAALLVFLEDAEAGVLQIALAGVEGVEGAFLRVPYSLDLGVLDPGALDPEELDGARVLALEIPAVANTEARTLGVELAASGTGVSTEPGSGEPLPERFELRANFPNPFNPATQLRFALPQASEVRLEVFDAAGRRVAVLAEGMRPAGVHTVSFEAGALSSGVYIARLTAPGFVQSRAMVLLK